MLIKMMRWLRVSGIVAVLVMGSGCGGSRLDLPLGEVQGTVTLDGQPFSGALVEFNPQFEPPQVEQGHKKSRPPRFGGSMAVTGPDGKYALEFDRHRKGAIVGVHSIRVRQIERTPNSPPLKLNHQVKGPTTVEVTKGKNSYDIELVTRDVDLVTR